MNGSRRRRFALSAAALAAAAALAGCGEGGSTAPATPGRPVAPTPPPIAAVVAFGVASAEVYEGDTASLPVRYEARSLAAPWRLRISPLPGGAQSADFSLPNAFVEIPAGAGAAGTVSLELTALADDEFEEGTETLSLRFVPDPSVNAQLGADLPVSIREGGVLVSFAAGASEAAPLEVPEGGGADLPIRYEVRNLAAPLDLALSTLAETADPEEFRLERSAVGVPAGRGLSGTTSVRLTASEDARFAEDDETGLVRFLPPPAGTVGVRLGADARFVIREGGASPCPGISIRALPPTTLAAGDGTFDEGLLFTTLTVTQSASAAEATLFQRSPYLLTAGMAERNWPPVSVLNFAGWRVEPQGGASRHSVDLRWPGEHSLVEPELEFGFVGGACSGAEIAACTAAGCELASGGATPPPPPTALGVPRGLTVTATGTDFIEFGWEAVAGATGYEIQLSLAQGDFGSVSTATVTGTRHRFSIEPGTTGYARVRALARNRVSDWSGVVAGTSRTTPTTVLATPQPRVSSTGPTHIEWSWDSIENAQGYQVQVAEGVAGLETAVLETITATTHRISVRRGTTWYLRCRAGVILPAPLAGDWSAPVAGTAQ